MLLLVADRETKVETERSFFYSKDDPDRTASVLHDYLYWTGKCHKRDTTKYHTNESFSKTKHYFKMRRDEEGGLFIPGQ